MSATTSTRAAGAVALALAVALAGCGREEAAPAPEADAATADARQAPPDPEPAEPVKLEDVSEITSTYVIGISYAPSAEQYPGLAAAMAEYAEEARQELMEAVEARSARSGVDPSEAMYDLSLAFSEVLVTPNVVAYAADGSAYTGGAHSIPLVARFVWLPPQRRMLTAERLVPEPEGWGPIAEYVRERLSEQLGERLADADVGPVDRDGQQRTGREMIEQGTSGGAEDFAAFEPLAGERGRLSGLRFVFPPYQVAPYSEGMQAVEVPAPVLLPSIAPELQVLFEGGEGADAAGVSGAVAAESS